MATKPQQGFLVIADITGFTEFLSKSELVHANEIIRDLLEGISNQFKPLVTIAELEGDAVFGYIPENLLIRKETLLEMLEATYVSFRDQLAARRRSTTCMCNACKNMSMLELKFFTHVGEYIVETIGGLKKLIGQDVIIIHRLLKNHINENTGWRAYSLFTKPTIDHIGMQLDNLHKEVEKYEHLGEVQTYSVNLQTRYDELVSARRFFITTEEADGILERRFSVAPPILWSWLNDPGRRSRWQEGKSWSVVVRMNGRSGIGAVNCCAHGKGESIETILDWRPFQYFSTGGQFSIKGKMMMFMTSILEPTEEGTQLRLHVQFKFPLPRWARRLIASRMLKKDIAPTWEILARLTAEEAKEQVTV